MPQFTRGELEVMKILWERGESKPAEIQESFPQPIKNAALRSYLRILLKKGHISRQLIGKAYHYTAKTRRQPALRSMLREIVDAWCDGSAGALLVSLLKVEKLSEAELLQLKRLADDERTTSGTSGR